MLKTTQFGSRDFHTSSTAAVPLRDLAALAVEWYRRAQSRRQLGELDARMLNDIGINRDIARQEARKPFWRA